MTDTMKAYCPNCKQVTMRRRKIGVGTLILVLLTGGLYLPLIFFHRKRCAICGC